MSQMDLLLGKGAVFSDCGTYRYLLWRVWDHDVEPVNFVMLNPSTADDVQDDPTIRRCEGFARAWGHGGIHVTNLYALRSTDPKALRSHEEPTGGTRNDSEILEAAATCSRVICAWGNHGGERAAGVTKLLTDRGHQLWCLGTNKNGSPVHPLYQPRDAALRPFPTPDSETEP